MRRENAAGVFPAPARRGFGKISGPVRAAPRMREAVVLKTDANDAVTWMNEVDSLRLAAH
jgi:hypothetical protein